MNKTVEQIKKHEGLRLKAYQDSVGVWTIGYGTNLQTLEIPIELAQLWLRLEVEKVELKLSYINWFRELNEARKAVVVNMAYNLGFKGLMNFKKTIKYIEIEQYDLASKEMLNSKWAMQVGARANQLSKQMKTGEWQ